jgi:transposase, IS605 OrfB family, central region
MMATRKVAQKIPFNPTKRQEKLIADCFGARRFAYNSQVAVFNTYSEKNKELKYPKISELKRNNEWLKESVVPSHSLSNAIMDFGKSRAAYFKKKQYAKNRPRFQSKHDYIQSFRNGVPLKTIRDNGRYQLSKKLGYIKIRKRDKLRYPIEQISQWTVKREGEKYYIVFLFTVEVEQNQEVNGSIGIDLGIKDFAITSDGEKIDLPKQIGDLEAKVIKEQRKLSRKQKGKGKQSNNFYKQKAKLQKAYTKVRHVRENFQHHVSKRIVEENQFIALETLRPSNMIKNHKLARAIARAGWRQFTNQLEYKAEWYGRTLQKVGQYYASSKTCGHCGTIYHDLKLSERFWSCSECGTYHDRDLNASQNILKEARRLAS